jgi:hypothetical protein
MEYDEALIIIDNLLSTIESAIQSRDWKVDGACDPDSIIRRAHRLLEDRGYMREPILVIEP